MANFISSFVNYFKDTKSRIGKYHYSVGSSVRMNEKNGSIQGLLAEIKSGLVFSYKDDKKIWYSLKKIFIEDSEDMNAALREIKFLKELSGYPAIAGFVDAATNSPDTTSHRKAECLILTEFFPKDSVTDFMKQRLLIPSNILKVFYRVCAAVKYMHGRPIPVIHRGIIVENLRITAKGYVKLWNFESATVQTWEPNESWTTSERVKLKIELESGIYLMHRAPETLDTSHNYPIGTSQDLWGLGCLLYHLCYGCHPFEKSTKLGIINGDYAIPENDQQYSIFHEMITGLLRPNPCQRLYIQEIINKVTALAKVMNVDLTKPLQYGYSWYLSDEEYRKNCPLPIMFAFEPVDSISVKICNWKEKNNGNIRGMLASLNEVLWEGAKKWIPPNLGKTEENDPLQKVYTDACLLVYPDNHIGSSHYDLTKAIYEELTSSMTKYNRSATRKMKLRRFICYCGLMILIALNLLFLSYFYPASEKEIAQHICPLIATPRQYFWVFWLPLLSLLYLGVRWLIFNQRPTTDIERKITLLVGSLPMCFSMIYYGPCKLVYTMFFNLEEEVLHSCFETSIQWVALLGIIWMFYVCIYDCLQYLKK